MMSQCLIICVETDVILHRYPNKAAQLSRRHVDNGTCVNDRKTLPDVLQES